MTTEWKVLDEDFVATHVIEHPTPEEVKRSSLVSDLWMAESSAKWAIYNLIYSEFISKPPTERLYDIGGGLSVFSKELFKNPKYTLVDPLHHAVEAERKFLSSLKVLDEQLVQASWNAIDFEAGATVVANDLFPNVDFRIQDFLQSVKRSGAARLVMTVTLHSPEKAIQVRTTETREILTILSFHVEEAIRTVSTELSVDPTKLRSSLLESRSPFANARKVAIIDARFGVN